MKQRKLVYRSFLLLFGFLVASSFAQVKTSNENIWLHYFGKNKLTEKLSLSFEATMRYANGFSEKQQYFVRPSFDYQFTKRFSASIGYSHYNTYVYGNPALNKTNIPEDHFWVQGTFVHQKGEAKFTHRLRDEFRYVGIAKQQPNGDFEINHYEYRNRLRYMIVMNYPFVKKENETQLFGILGDEVFLNLGSNAGKTLLNQNRIIAGFGYNFDKNHKLQLCYMQQHIWNFANTLQEDNPTVRLSYVTNFDWRK